MLFARGRHQFSIEKYPDGYLAYFPAYAGCVTWGRTSDEAIARAVEALDLYLQTLVDAGDCPPEALGPERMVTGVALTAVSLRADALPSRRVRVASTLAFLRNCGFGVDRENAGHAALRDSKRRRTVIVPTYTADIPRWLMRKIFEDAGLCESDYQSLL